jgi:uncharacterized membrane protein HdeD (DUF308 family)
MSDDLTAADVSSQIRRAWWLPILRGIVLLILGLLMLIQPKWSLAALVWIFGIFVILDGVIAIVQWFGNRKEPGAGWFLLSGLMSVVLGVVVVVWPSATVTVLFYLIAAWVLLLGILAIITSAVLYRAHDEGWYWVLTFGLVSFLFSLLLFTHPQLVPTVIVVLLGMFAFVGGVVQIVSGFATRRLAKDVTAAL